MVVTIVKFSGLLMIDNNFLSKTTSFYVSSLYTKDEKGNTYVAFKGYIVTCYLLLVTCYLRFNSFEL